VKQVKNIGKRVARAVTHFWRTRQQQKQKQGVSGKRDQGARSAVTGGAQMDGLIDLLSDLILTAGINEKCLFRKRCLELPGFFRPTKEWDLLAVKDGQLILAIEVKSQVGPSFGNNFNNRTEEALGSALDLWTAFKKGALNRTVRPWLGYVFLLEDCERSRAPVRVSEPHFAVFPEFKDASYAKRYELLCRKLVRERHYDAASFLMSGEESGLRGSYIEPADDLTFEAYARSLVAHAAAYAG
jgi:hypothetical protein